METEHVENRIKYLRSTILYHNDLYYNQNRTEISDYEYDMLQQELRKLEADFPQFASDTSPTKTVGGKAQSGFKKIKHEVQMNSLQDVFSFEEVESFVNKILSEYPDAKFCVEPKIDGLSVSIQYENGEFTVGSTRGDGFIGEDVSDNIAKIKTVPKIITDKAELFEVRGECYMPKKSFDALVAEQLANGEEPAKNPRNAASGALRQKNPEITVKRNLDILIFNVQRIKGGKTFSSHKESLDYLKNMGFNTVPGYTVKDNFEDIKKAIESIGNNRNHLTFDIDGVVIKIDSLEQRNELGANSKTPNWAVAYKFPPEEKQTVLREIKTEVGRTGVITPVAIFDAITLAGTSVTKATLHNQKFIADRHIDINDVITVRKAGDIIPEVLGTAKKVSKRDHFTMPDTCPCCNSPINKTDSAYYCENPHCDAQQLAKIIHFVSRPAMNIDGLGDAIIKQLIDAKLISTAADLYSLNEDDLLQLEGFKQKSASNLIKAIEKSKSNEFYRVINGIGIRNVGTSASKLLCDKFRTIDELLNADTESICSIDTFGEITANSIYAAMHDKTTLEIIDKLKSAGVNMSNIAAESASDLLNGKTFVVTGTMETMTRDEISKLITDNGGKVSGSVSKKTDYLVAGDKAGSKLAKANSLGVKVISENDLLDMLK